MLKDRQVLLDAYDDKQGVTAAFNKNLLQRINAELNADFDLSQFNHQSRFNEKLSRIEMHLISNCDQTVTVNGESFSFSQGESIHTENSHKYALQAFTQLSAQAGLRLEQTWQDEQGYFALCLLRPI